MMRATRAACVAWEARSARTWPSNGRPSRARSPMRSRALWRQHSSGARRPPGLRTPADVTFLAARELDVVVQPHLPGYRDVETGKEVGERVLHGQRDGKDTRSEERRVG